MRKKFGLRSVVGLTAIVAALVVVPLALAGAINTTTDSGQTVGTVTSTGVCVNGPDPTVNCNIYSQKEDVFLSGSPTAASLDTGTYYFAVLDPGGQRDPNPGATGVLSNDATQEREFSITDGATGAISYIGSHTFDATNNKLSVFPYDDTSNPGGVYILAVCKISDTTEDYTDSVSVKPSDCKYDAFKVLASVPNCDPNIDPTCGPPPASDLVVTKDATPAWSQDYDWAVAKSQLTSSTAIRTSSSTVSVSYRVTATWSVAGNTYGLSGTIHVNNPNTYDVTGVGVTDQVLSDTTTDPVTVDSNASCTVQDGSYGSTTGISHTNGTIPALTTVDYSYSCTFTGTPSGSETNRATASWDSSNGLPDTSGYGDAAFTWPSTPTSTTHATTTVTDAFNGGAANTLGVANVNGTFTKDSANTLSNWSDSYNSATKTFTLLYSRLVTVSSTRCTTYNNTATVSTDSDTSNNSASASVTVCPTVNGLTIGYWQNKNGQGRISGGASTAGVCNSGTSLRQYAPFQDLSTTATCSQVATYVYNVIKAANASGSSMNAMLKAQMLATALNVFFGVTNGNEQIDLTQVCKMIDGSGGTATCSGTYQNVSAAFGGATHLTVLQILSYAAGQSNLGGSIWYGQVKTTQELAKNTFDAINNGVALAY